MTAEIVVSVVVNASQTEAVLFGPNGCADSMPPVRSSFVGNHGARRRARAGGRLEASGGLYLDAPMSGGAARGRGRADGARVRQCRGLAAARRCSMRWRPPCTSWAMNPGWAPRSKWSTSCWLGVHIAAASEAIVFAARLGLELGKVYEVITASAGNSWMFKNRVPHVWKATIDRVARWRSSPRILASCSTSPAVSSWGCRWRIPPAAVSDDCLCRHGRDDDASVARLLARVADVTLPDETAEASSERRRTSRTARRRVPPGPRPTSCSALWAELCQWLDLDAASC